jgi:hypothetical protein
LLNLGLGLKTDFDGLGFDLGLEPIGLLNNTGELILENWYNRMNSFPTLPAGLILHASHTITTSVR